MFYTFVQSRVRGNFKGDRLLCVEADTWEEANERAIYFGLNLGVQECPCCPVRWRAATPSNPRPNSQPWWDGHLLNERYGRDYGDTFTVLYKDDNLFSSGSLNLEREIEEFDDVPEASEYEEQDDDDDWHVYDSGYCYDDDDYDPSP